MQEFTLAIDTIKAKENFWKHALAHGFNIKHYFANDGIFASRGF
jgi:hypothetical protein